MKRAPKLIERNAFDQSVATDDGFQRRFAARHSTRMRRNRFCGFSCSSRSEDDNRDALRRCRRERLPKKPAVAYAFEINTYHTRLRIRERPVNHVDQVHVQFPAE